ncbi:MAG: DUF429 domain-containing protein [Burkholderiaceae bacterium]
MTTAQTPFTVYGIDFSSAPSLKKPITVAVGQCDPQRGLYRLAHVSGLTSLPAFETFLTSPGPWIGGFDLPFGQPRPLIVHEGWPTDWRAFVAFYCAADRHGLRTRFKAWCDGRPVGDKFAWRATDKPAGSSPAMRWTNPPVAWMMQAGIGRMVQAGLCFPAHGDRCPGPDDFATLKHSGQQALPSSGEPSGGPSGGPRVALEAYPGFTARKVTTRSYKSDDRARQDTDRAQNRQKILRALLQGSAGLSVRLEASATWIRHMTIDGSGDLIDAAICALQAAHAALQPGFGLPTQVDPLEGWIAAVPAASVPADEPGRARL